jgi:catechol 2,3-dioxygenase-like lactoylglutathione lyase family enzyme
MLLQRITVARTCEMTTVLKVLSGVCAVFLLEAVQSPAASAQLPGLRGIDHIGLTVPNLEEAVDFFVNVIGCEEFFSNNVGPFDNDWMKENLNVDPRASLTNRRVRCSNGANFELFEYQSGDQRTVQLKNSGYGGHHFAFYVDDIDAAVAYLRRKGLKILGDIKRDTAGATKGLSWVPQKLSKRSLSVCDFGQTWPNNHRFVETKVSLEIGSGVVALNEMCNRLTGILDSSKFYRGWRMQAENLRSASNVALSRTFLSRVVPRLKGVRFTD